MDVSISITKARADLAFDSPFFGSTAIRLKMVEKLDLNPPTLAVDGKNIFYHPDYVATLSESTLKGAIVHETLHVIMLHHTRRGNRHPVLWNIAGDYAINPIVKNNGFKLGEGWLYDPQYEHMSAERIYDILAQEFDPEDLENKEGLPSPQDMIIEPADEEERKIAEVEAKELQSTGLAAAKEAGKSPYGMEGIIQQLQKPQIRWQDQLREYLTDSVNGNPMWHIPNRRLLNTVYLPHYEKEPSGSIVIAFDVSCSVSEKEIQQYASEIQQIAQDNNLERIHVLYVNTRVCKTQSFDSNDDVELKPMLGGGTAFQPAFEWVEEQDIQPHALVYFTDGEASFNFEPPPYPTIWCISTKIIAPWGKTVSLENLL